MSLGTLSFSLGRCCNIFKKESLEGEYCLVILHFGYCSHLTNESLTPVVKICEDDFILWRKRDTPSQIFWLGGRVKSAFRRKWCRLALQFISHLRRLASGYLMQITFFKRVGITCFSSSSLFLPLLYYARKWRVNLLVTHPPPPQSNHGRKSHKSLAKVKEHHRSYGSHNV